MVWLEDMRYVAKTLFYTQPSNDRHNKVNASHLGIAWSLRACCSLFWLENADREPLTWLIKGLSFLLGSVVKARVKKCSLLPFLIAFLCLS